MLRSTVAEEQEQAQPLSEAVQAHNDTNISATNLNDDEVKPFYTAAKKGTTSISSSESPPLMLNKFRLAAEKRTVKSNKRTITGSLTGGKYRSSNSRNENEPSTKKQKQGAKNPFAKGRGSPEKPKKGGVFTILSAMKSPSQFDNSKSKLGALGRKSTMSKLARDNYSKNKNVI